jgi:hypothetical protein
MKSTQNLSGKEAVQKLRSLTGSTPTCMFGSGLVEVTPMQVQRVDQRGR